MQTTTSTTSGQPGHPGISRPTTATRLPEHRDEGAAGVLRLPIVAITPRPATARGTWKPPESPRKHLRNWATYRSIDYPLDIDQEKAETSASPHLIDRGEAWEAVQHRLHPDHLGPTILEDAIDI